MLTDYSATSHRKHGKSTQTGQNVAKCHPKKMSEKLCETAKWSDNYNDDWYSQSPIGLLVKTQQNKKNNPRVNVTNCSKQKF